MRGTGARRQAARAVARALDLLQDAQPALDGGANLEADAAGKAFSQPGAGQHEYACSVDLELHQSAPGVVAGFQKEVSFGDAVARHLDKDGIKLAYHHHMGTVIQAEDEIDRMMDSTKAVGLLLDSGHLTFAGGDPMRVLERHAKRIVHVHCKDIRQDKLARVLQQDSSFLDAVLGDVFAVPGDGSIDFEPILRSLANHNYSSWLVVEADQDPAKAHPLMHARIGHDCLRPLARRYWTQ